MEQNNPLSSFEECILPFEELSNSGLLWLINRTVFHPRGYALALAKDESDKAIGWQLLGDGWEPLTYTEDTDNLKFKQVVDLFDRLKEANAPKS